ncbi:hypothetical protein [Nonomuraea sp. NPDC005650]
MAALVARVPLIVSSCSSCERIGQTGKNEGKRPSIAGVYLPGDNAG